MFAAFVLIPWRSAFLERYEERQRKGTVLYLYFFANGKTRPAKARPGKTKQDQATGEGVSRRAKKKNFFACETTKAGGRQTSGGCSGRVPYRCRHLAKGTSTIIRSVIDQGPGRGCRHSSTLAVDTSGVQYEQYSAGYEDTLIPGPRFPCPCALLSFFICLSR